MSIPKIKSLRFLLSCILITAYCILNSPPALAGGEFSTSFHSDYQIDQQGITTVTHDISITNLLSHIYTTEYTILISSPDLTEITASQDNQIIEFVTNTSDTTTQITLKNLAPVIGQGQTSTLTISYLTPNIAELLERTWSINIPKLTKANEASEFIRTVHVPISLGTPSAQYPEATTMTTDSQQTTLIYKGHPNQSLSLLFGNSEYYHLDLIYEITNPTLSPADTEIALPPDTAYQKVILDSITPPPNQIRLDDDNNWLATYSLKANESITINASLYLEVFALPQSTSTLDSPNSLTQDLPYWEVKDSAIIELADRLNTPLNIYNYLVTNLTYDHARLATNPTRLGALATLDDPSSALCTEYTDLFIALSRSLNVPARELNGYAYTSLAESRRADSSTLRPLGVATADILHAWPEYYDIKSSTWIQLDPTWGHTTGGVDYFHKLDFNHLTFVIHGAESNYPLPAGAYKTDPTLSTISVELVGELPPIIDNLQESTTDSTTTIHNLGNTSTTHQEYGYLPPYGQLTISTSSLTNSNLIPNLYPWFLLVFIIITVSFFIHHHSRKAG